MILHLFNEATEENLKESDAICTALQLINFWQDVAIDLRKNRIYIPQNLLKQHSLNDRDLFKLKSDPKFRHLMAELCERTRKSFMAGKPLGSRLTGSLGVEIRLTWLTGYTILDKLVQAKYDMFTQRPVLTKKDIFRLFWVALNRRWYERYSS